MGVVRDDRRPCVILFNRRFEVKPKFYLTAGRHGLQLVVNLWVAVVELKDRPHDSPARRLQGSRDFRERLVLAEEEEFAGLKRTVTRWHYQSLFVETFRTHGRLHWIDANWIDL